VANAETLQHVVASDDADVGLMLSMEGLEALDDDPDAFAPLYDAGVPRVLRSPLHAYARHVARPARP
jgi:microsomal dipeptidase-like Zn-dependent dipeptidase